MSVWRHPAEVLVALVHVTGDVDRQPALGAQPVDHRDLDRWPGRATPPRPRASAGLWNDESRSAGRSGCCAAARPASAGWCRGSRGSSSSCRSPAPTGSAARRPSCASPSCPRHARVGAELGRRARALNTLYCEYWNSCSPITSTLRPLDDLGQPLHPLGSGRPAVLVAARIGVVCPEHVQRAGLKVVAAPGVVGVGVVVGDGLSSWPGPRRAGRASSSPLEPPATRSTSAPRTMPSSRAATATRRGRASESRQGGHRILQGSGDGTRPPPGSTEAL